MPIFRLTQKLQQEMSLKAAHLVDLKKELDPFEEWYAHIFLLNLKKQIIFVEPKTLFSFTLENVSRKDLQRRFSEFFEKGLSRALYHEGASSSVMGQVLKHCRTEHTFAKTRNRSTVGALNEFIKHHKFNFYDGKNSHLRDRYNRYLPIRGFAERTTKSYQFSIEIFSQTIQEQFGLDFKPQSEDFFEEIQWKGQ